MNYRNAFNASGAFIATFAAFQLVVPSVNARPQPVVVTAERDAVTERVSYRDLNLARANDQAILNRRIGTAVRTVCAPPNEGLYSVVSPDCRWEAWNGAKPQIARAVERANQMAQYGTSAISAVAITVSAP